MYMRPREKATWYSSRSAFATLPRGQLLYRVRWLRERYRKCSSGDSHPTDFWWGSPRNRRAKGSFNLSDNCFGDYLTRTGIDVPTRELLTFSILVSLGGCDAQVRGHVAANLNLGNDRARLIDVLTQLLPFTGYPRTLNGLLAIDEVTGS